MTMYKVHTVRGTHNSSMGDTEYFETREECEDAVLCYLIEAHARTMSRSPHRWTFYSWRKHKMKGDPGEDRICDVKVWRQDGDEWIEVHYDVEPPRLVERSES